MNTNKRPTIYDIAEKLGISSGSVYRALNNTGRVSAQTRQRVLDAAQEMGYVANKAAQSLRRTPVRIGVILCCPVENYLNDIRSGVEAALEELRRLNVIGDIRDFGCVNSEQRRAEIKQTMVDFKESGYQGAALFLSGNNAVFADTIREMVDGGMRVATIANDITGSARSLSVSADGNAAGRLAAQILSIGCRGGRISILTGRRSTGIHSSKVSGFLDEAGSRDLFSQIDIIEHDGTDAAAIARLRRILTQDPPDGVYVSAALPREACEWIASRSVGNVRIVMTDLRPEQKRLLTSGAVCAAIYQNPRRQGKWGIERLYAQIDAHKEEEEIFRIVPQALFVANFELCEM